MTTKPFTFEDQVREYKKEQLELIASRGASLLLFDFQDTNDLYEQYEGEMWAILSTEAEKQGKSALIVLLDYAENWKFMNEGINDGDHLRQALVWYCVEHVAKQILAEPEEEEEAE